MVRCQHCGHEWDTKSRKRYVSCPNCLYKVKNIMPEDEGIAMEHFNLDANGVKILDRSLATKNSPNGRIVEVYFKPSGTTCAYCQLSNCAHVQFALGLPAVQNILRRKGWKQSR